MALLNVALSDEILVIRLQMLSGNALMGLGRWFELTFELIWFRGSLGCKLQDDQ